MKSAHHKNQGPAAAELIEEAVHLLRSHPGELAGYYAATCPFVVTLLYFWAYVSWFRPADGAVALGALVLAGLFGVMKAGQHRFARRLMARRLGAEPPVWTGRQWLSESAAQFRLQAAGVIAVPLAALFAVPFGWIYAYYQNATVLAPEDGGDSAARRHQAWAQALLWPKQNHWALAIIGALWLMVFLNMAVAFYQVPSLISDWLGLKTIFALKGWSYLNSTFLALVTALTHLLVDPLIKAFYLLRIFHGRSRQTGADLRLVLLREKSGRRRLATGVLAGLIAGAALLTPARLRAAEPAARAPVTQTAPAPALDQALDRVLEQPEFRWRLQPLPVPRAKEKEGIITGFVRSTFDTVRQIYRTVDRWMSDFKRWVDGILPGKKRKRADPGTPEAGAGAANPFDWMAALQLFSTLLLVAVAGLLLFVAWKVWRHNRLTLPLAAGAAAGPVGVPDLRDETVQASRLPVDGWLDLARRQMAAGEWRLALRALFLALLARHAQEGLMVLAKHKTNLDYEHELRRRAHSRTGLVEEFHDRRRRFEEVWYGTIPADDALAREWLQRMEGRP